jgi:hypothetical protein
LLITSEQKTACNQRQEFNRVFANGEIIRVTALHCFTNFYHKTDATKECKMLEVKKNQHLGCGKD